MAGNPESVETFRILENQTTKQKNQKKQVQGKWRWMVERWFGFQWRLLQLVVFSLLSDVLMKTMVVVEWLVMSVRKALVFGSVLAKKAAFAVVLVEGKV